METLAARNRARLARTVDHAEQVREHLVILGARVEEVCVSYEALAAATGLSVPDVAAATHHLEHAGQIVRDRRRDVLVAYSYRVIR